MVQYKAANQMYPGDERMCGATQQKKHRCSSNECSIVKCADNIKRVSYECYEEEKREKVKAMLVDANVIMSSYYTAGMTLCSEILLKLWLL